jgi:hypothetical protein
MMQVILFICFCGGPGGWTSSFFLKEEKIFIMVKRV